MELDTNTNLSSVDTGNTSFFSSLKSYTQNINLKHVLIILGLVTIGFLYYNYYYNTTDKDEPVEDGEPNEFVDLEVNESVESSPNTSGVETVGPASADILTNIEDTLQEHNNEKNNENIESDQNDSSIQMPKKGGYCYIGEDRGQRSCMAVGKRDVCMSGDIFPSMEICINPNLRS